LELAKENYDRPEGIPVEKSDQTGEDSEGSQLKKPGKNSGLGGWLTTGRRKKMENKSEITKAAAALGRKGGRSTSPAKKRASRENGKKGGYFKMFFYRTDEDGNAVILHKNDGSAVTQIAADVYPIGSVLSARYEHPTGIVLSLDDARKLGIDPDV